MFDGTLPILKDDDPEFVHTNAAFIALANPPSRRVLELLAVAPRDLRDFNAHVGIPDDSMRKLLKELQLVGFVRVQGGRWELGGPALGRIRDWLALLG